MLQLLDENGQLSGHCLHLQFPAMPWIALSNSFFAQMWVSSYTLSFEGVLAQWEAGNFDQTRPANALSWGGLYAAIKWS